MTDSLVIASDPAEMIAGQKFLIQSIESKRLAAIEDAKSAHDAKESMIAARLDVVAARCLHRRATARVVYLTKIETALRAGYVMMPDMPGDIVAVRVDRHLPERAARGWTQNWRPAEQSSQSLPAGVGRYVSPVPKHEISQRETGKYPDGKPRYERHTRAVALRDPFGLNHRFIRPEVLSRTSAAMLSMNFDEIVTVTPQDTRRKGRDPIVLGRVVDNVNRTVAAFLIAWFCDTREL